MNLSKHLYIIILLALNSCVEPIEIKEVNSESYLVVEANLTNQLKKHTVKITRSFMLNDSIPRYELNAKVRIIDDSQNTFTFYEKTKGLYESNNTFKAEVGRNYTLLINTSDGNEYSSTPENISGINKIDEIKIEKGISNKNTEGLNINVISNTKDSNSNYYRYEYDETYKIVAPYWSPYEIVPVSRESPFLVSLKLKDYQNKICYKTVRSSSIIQTETLNLDENNVNFTIRFLEKNDFIISHRYSILVKQYVQSAEAYRYFQVLKKLASSQNPFSLNQPGSIYGNITNKKDSSDKIFGFFEVTSYSEKRFFFNYNEIYPNESITYPFDCSLFAPKISDMPPPLSESPLIESIDSGKYIYYSINTQPSKIYKGPYFLVPKICGDCRVLGTNKKPTFWVD